MTNPTKKQAVREAVIKACPELMELTFGCRVCLNVDKWPYETIVKKDDFEEAFVGVHIEFGSNEITKILGHLIGIAEVLRAIDDKQKQVLPNWAIALSAAGLFAFQDGTKFKTTNVQWNLTKSLDGQSDETIDFIYQILIEGR